MTADDLFAIPRDHLVARLITQSQQLDAQAQQLGVLTQHVDAQALLLATRDERIASLEGQKAELDLKLQQALKELYGPSSEKKPKAAATTDNTLLGVPATSEPEPPPADPELETITSSAPNGRPERGTAVSRSPG